MNYSKPLSFFTACLLGVSCSSFGLAQKGPPTATVSPGEDPQSPTAADTPSVPDGDPKSVSEWGLSGLVWSEANLVRKMSVEVLQDDEAELSDEERRQMRQLAVGSGELIQRLEQFGWRRLSQRQSVRVPGMEPVPGDAGAVVPDDDNIESLADDDLPDPDVVGRQLAESLGLEPEPNPPAVENDDGVKVLPPEKPTRRASRYDTETPVGTEDPGIDDERMANDLRIDIDHYRVDDFIDETPRESRNMADAREDGVEQAIAAASNDGIAGPSAGYVSRREIQTRSATLPYALDSIYDADDYDPDVDYNVENRLTPRQINREAVDELDGDDDVSLDRPAIAAEGEDELLAAMERGETADLRERRQEASMARVPNTVASFNSTPPTNPADANWVQLHLELNQQRWEVANATGVTPMMVQAAARRLEVTLATVARLSDSSTLQAILR